MFVTKISCSRCHAPCTIDLRRLLDGGRHDAVCFEVMLMIFSSVRRPSEIHEAPPRGTAVVFQLVLVVVGTSFQLTPVYVSPSGDDSTTARHLDISVLLLPEVEHLAPCIDRQSVPLLCTLHLRSAYQATVCVSVSSYTKRWAITLRSCSPHARLGRSVHSIIRKCGILSVVLTSAMNEQRAVQETCRGACPTLCVTSLLTAPMRIFLAL